ncbi:MAG: ABC transporter ATP-binding protein [Gammaproteobacteria bacterium]|nr:ABC transporter ATP-binding protein [Gammaproteobacteria bacterium]
MPLLEVRGLEVKFPIRQYELTALRDVSFSLDKGQRLGIVGESGAGKSVAAFAILNLIGRPGYISKGEIIFEGANLAKMSPQQLRTIRGNRINMIFQDPMMTLNPVLTIGTQMIECLQTHQNLSKGKAREVAIEKLRQVQIPSPHERIDQYPHELSGGMRQRVVIAIALLTDPSVIIADEPTTALDVTIQAEIMELLVELCETSDVALMLITHDLGVVSQVTQRTIVMYAGRVVEEGPTRQIIENARHPYTHGLIDALPERTNPGMRLNQIPGVMPSLNAIPKGCSFHPRCEHQTELCRTELPGYVGQEGIRIACHWVASQEQQQ